MAKDNRRSKPQVKHFKFAKNVIKCEGNGKKAYMLTYPNAKETTAEANASRLMKNEHVQNDIALILHKSKLTDNYIAKKLYDKTKAKKVILDNDGNVIAKIDDHAIQLKAIENAFKYKGYDGSKAPQVDARQVTINMNNDSLGEGLNSITKSLAMLNKSLGMSEDIQTGELADVKGINPDEVIDGEVIE